jgi:hypothetical protein
LQAWHPRLFLTIVKIVALGKTIGEPSARYAVKNGHYFAYLESEFEIQTVFSAGVEECICLGRIG